MEIIEQLSIDEWESSFDFSPSYNIAPTHIVPTLVYDGRRIVKPMRWGLIPHWLKEEKVSTGIINARAETLTQKPSFSDLTYKNRCIVITDGYYEWIKEGSNKVPYYICRLDNSIIPMAGLWDLWKSSKSGEEIYTYTIITTNINPALSWIHERMPVIIPNENIDIWINWKSYLPSDALGLLRPYSGELKAYRVSPIVNSVKNNSPECIKGYK
jgi:putative SOS response-associated peptidase YedK